MNVVLIGYRGTGKSAVGRMTAERLGLAFIDADEELERRAGRTIREIFAADGESAFRDLESQVVSDLLTRDQQVVALGGGAVLREENRRAIVAPNNRVAWLQAKAETVWERIQVDSATAQRRPNLTESGGLAEIICLLNQRAPLYRECAGFTVDTENKSIAEVADEVVSLVS
jgi:shikimate kinase